MKHRGENRTEAAIQVRGFQIVPERSRRCLALGKHWLALSFCGCWVWALALTQSQGRADIRLLDSSEMRDVAKGALVPFDLGKFRLRYLKPHGPFLPGEPSTR